MTRPTPTTLAAANYDALGTYCTTMAAACGKPQVSLRPLHPPQRPRWEWSGGQEGSPFRNSELAGVAQATRVALAAKRLPTKVLVTAVGKFNYLYETADQPERGDRPAAFLALNRHLMHAALEVALPPEV